MVSLSTIYGVSIVLGSIAAIGSAFVGTKVYPIQTGGDPLAGPTVLAATLTGAFAAAKKAIEPAPEPLKVETVKEEAPVVEEPVDTEDEKSKIKFEENLVGGDVRTYTPDTDQHDKIVYIESMPPSDFFDKQIEFLNTLSDNEKLILNSYGLHGDSLINSILRNKYTSQDLLNIISKIKTEYGDNVITQLFNTSFEEITEKNVEEVSKTYLEKFKEIFNKVPTVTTQFKVFRGTDSPTSEFKGFISTTYDPMSNTLSTFTGPSCCVYELIVMPGVKALWLEPISKFSNEREIIIDQFSKVDITNQTSKEIWTILTKTSNLTKSTKTVYEGTIQRASPPSGGNRRVPPWFKYSGTKH